MKLSVNEVNASLWKRVLAYIIDAAIINIIVVWPFQKSIDKLTGGFSIIESYKFINQNTEIAKSNFPALIMLFSIISVLTIAYWAILEYKTGQTIGKMLMKIYVKSDKKILTLGQSIARNISKISGILLLIDCIGIIGNKQRFLERISNTRVVEKRFTI